VQRVIGPSKFYYGNTGRIKFMRSMDGLDIVLIGTSPRTELITSFAARQAMQLGFISRK